ncbi:UNVERIFIED_CONTAM: hypothetical protein Sradi_7191200 [Sesamum radiatum]|uniref:Uncharacterized protein n=1 Tax=Sesamum radiatum TaxID=300843 RepID=A0AAW2IRG6_SESRA
MEDTSLIQFGRAERSGPRASNNDALVITAVLANYEVGRIFIDSGSSADILFGETYDQMQLGDVSLEKVNTLLYGFAGEVVQPRGMISFPLTMGTCTTRKTCMLKVLVVDVPSAYNCHVEAVRKRQKRNLDEKHQGVPSSKKGKEIVVEGSPRKWRHLRRGKTKEEIISCLRHNADIFAWGTTRFRGNRHQGDNHHLNIDPGIKPMKQKKRHFRPEKDKVIQAEIDKLMAAGQIEEIQFPEWLSNVVLVPKSGGKWRMCIDFRDLNKARPKDFTLYRV